jgi:hypothetical protein
LGDDEDDDDEDEDEDDDEDDEDDVDDEDDEDDGDDGDDEDDDDDEDDLVVVKSGAWLGKLERLDDCDLCVLHEALVEASQSHMSGSFADVPLRVES